MPVNIRSETEEWDSRVATYECKQLGVSRKFDVFKATYIMKYWLKKRSMVIHRIDDDWDIIHAKLSIFLCAVLSWTAKRNALVDNKNFRDSGANLNWKQSRRLSNPYMLLILLR